MKFATVRFRSDVQKAVAADKAVVDALTGTLFIRVVVARTWGLL